MSVSIERLFNGQPIISPRGDSWESGVTFNTAAVYLEPTLENTRTIQALAGDIPTPNGVVALHYRARPKKDAYGSWNRSYVGLSVHHPDLTPIRRFPNPVVVPGPCRDDVDSLGVEDPRITFLDGSWWMVYCGVAGMVEDAVFGSVCMARSDDLVCWNKLGMALGDGDGFAHSESRPPKVWNKDGVLFPDRIGGKAYMLHRPMNGEGGSHRVCLARSDDPGGPYDDLGPVHGTEIQNAWVGAGSVPIRIGDGRYVSIEHTGMALDGGARLYVLDAYLYDFNRLDPSRAESLVASRIEGFMRPETDFEVNGPFPDSVGNVVFTCGSFVHDGWLNIVYGGGDSYILAARMRLHDLVSELES